jgi:hypothetical protein
MSVEPNKIIYSMIGVSKFFNKRPVLKDIYPWIMREHA